MDLLKRLIGVACLAVLLVMSRSVAGTAAETVLTTVVPEKMTMYLELSGSGQVCHEGSCYVRSTGITVCRHQDAVFRIQPSDGWQLGRVTYDGVDQRRNIRDSVLTLKEVQPDSVLHVTFVSRGGIPLTGDTAIGWGTSLALLSLGTLIALAFLKKEQTKNLP